MRNTGKNKNSVTVFTPLSALIKQKQKNPEFKKAFTEEMSRLKLAHDIRILRQQRRMTQGEVARKAEMPRSVIARIESGTHNFSIATLHKLASVFDRKIRLVK
ncbi:helix-turn-helix domain-containing protein [Patescibacteria group bacterium]|nr:helix-turn-helix domain-containing protein [Patescibacteria group bacterium]